MVSPKHEEYIFPRTLLGKKKLDILRVFPVAMLTSTEVGDIPLGNRYVFVRLGESLQPHIWPVKMRRFLIQGLELEKAREDIEEREFHPCSLVQVAVLFRVSRGTCAAKMCRDVDAEASASLSSSFYFVPTTPTPTPEPTRQLFSLTPYWSSVWPSQWSRLLQNAIASRTLSFPTSRSCTTFPNSSYNHGTIPPNSRIYTSRRTPSLLPPHFPSHLCRSSSSFPNSIGITLRWIGCGLCYLQSTMHTTSFTRICLA